MTISAVRNAIAIRNLTARSADRVLVAGIDLDIAAGGVTAIIGSSGSGKTTTALALMGEHQPGVTVSMDRRDAPGVRFGYVPQQPSAVLNPALRIGTVLRDIERAGTREGYGVPVAQALQRAGFPTDPAMLRRYPHQLSGGQQQRLVIAQTLLTDPTCLILDEPTTGQDSVNRAAILDEIARLSELGLTIVLLTHDLDAVRAVAQHVIVMSQGAVVEKGAIGLLAAPKHEHTLALVRAQARAVRPSTRRAGSPAPSRLSVDSISAGFRSTSVLEKFSFAVDPGECIALVGPSGCGKTTAARVVAGLHRPRSGRVVLDGRVLAGSTHARTRRDLASIAYVFQDAKAAFDPYRTVWEQVVRGPLLLGDATAADAAAAAHAALEQVGLERTIALARPSALSGGEAQRAALARALAVGPSVLICDEITTGLDSVSQRRVLDILYDLTRTRQISLVMISHDADVVHAVADTVVDMQAALDFGVASDECS